MASKKNKSKSNRTKSKVATAKRAKKAVRKKQAKSQKKPVEKKRTTKKALSQSRLAPKRKAPRRSAQPLESSWGRQGAVLSRQSGDLEGLSRTEQADSQSVEELVEEGNTVEAGAVAGVEQADDQDTKEVHTHEVPEDDVPGEYLDKD